MSTRKRGFIEIVGEILTTLDEKPFKKSHIAYKCNLILLTNVILIHELFQSI